MSARYANEQQPQQVEEEYVEEVEQYGVAEDDGAQYYEEYVEVEADVGGGTPGPTEYYQQQQETKPRISNHPLSHPRIAVVPSYYSSGRANIPPQHFAAHRYPSTPQYGLGGSMRYPSPNYGNLRPRGQLYPPPHLSMYGGRSGGFGAGGGYPAMMGASVDLPNFLSKAKVPKSRKSANKRKPCNCTKSQCLKLYCDCFANGEFCLDCNCKDCHNNLDHEQERSRAIKQSLERNPSAFKPKIGVAAKAIGKTIDMERLHQRGCHCKRSNCLKNYCECYEAKVPCTDRCKCQACKNTEHDRHHKFKDKFSTTAGGLAQLAAAAAAERSQHNGTPGSEENGGGGDAGGSDICVVDGTGQRTQNPKTQPWFYMTEDVIEATTMCLVAQAQQFEQTMTEEELERSVLKEFGRCLEQIIESAGSCLPQAQQQQPQGDPSSATAMITQ